MSRLHHNKVFMGFFVMLIAFGLGLTGCQKKKKKGTESSALGQVIGQSNVQATSTPAPPMITQRGQHRATKLANGDVLITGGLSSLSQVTAAAEVWAGAAFGNTQTPMSSPRVDHTAVLLNNGKVLVAGGRADVAGNQVLATTELYDPATRSFSPGPALTKPRAFHTATQFVFNGMEFVILAGGVNRAQGAQSPVVLDDAELYLASANQMVPINGRMTSPHYEHQAALLSTGKVLIQGGSMSFAGGNAAAELYDPATNTFSMAPPMIQSRSHNSLTALQSGDVLAIGGKALAVEASAEAFQAAAGIWTPLNARLLLARMGHTATELLDSRIVVAGGSDGSMAMNSSECYTRPAGAPVFAGSFIPGPQLVNARRSHSATLLNTGKILLAGGFDLSGQPMNAAELLDMGPAQGQQGGSLFISSITPPNALPGSIVTITGSGFSPNPQQNIVRFGNLPAQVISATPNSLQVIVPQGAATGLVTVMVNGQISNGFMYTGINGTQPVLSSLSPPNGKEGTIVTLRGANFQPQAVNTVTFNGVSATITSVLPNQILAIVPAGSQTGPVVVESAGQKSNALVFTVDGPAPQLILAIPSSGSAGGITTLTGRNLDKNAGNNQVFFGNQPAAGLISFNFNLPSIPILGSLGQISEMVVMVPANLPAGPTFITVEVNGKKSNAIAFTVTGGNNGGYNPPPTNPGNVSLVVTSAPQSVTKGGSFTIGWNVSGASYVSHANVHLDTLPHTSAEWANPGTPLMDFSPTQTGGSGSYTAQMTENNYGASALYYVVHIEVGGVSYYSAQQQISVIGATQPPATTTTVTVTSAPASVAAGANFTIGWTVSGASTVSHANVHWDTASHTSQEWENYAGNFGPIQSGASGPYSNTIQAPATPGTIYYVVHVSTGSQEIYTLQGSIQVQ